MTDKKFISTTLPYLNISRVNNEISIGHVGHAFEFIIADIIVSHHRQKYGSNNTFFNVGVDEHGQKIAEKAKEEGFINIQDYCDIYAQKWKEFCILFHIDYDNFYRTSSEEHKKQTKQFYEDIKDFLYEKEYEGYYCKGCESFITEKEIVDNKCPIHGIELKKEKEVNTFFKLSEFKNIADVLVDKSKSTELKNLIAEDYDLSITRKNVDWGVKTTNNDTYYVWAEALLNYVISAGYGTNNENFKDFWDNSLIICGKDNLKFQAYILQALLQAKGIPQTKEILVHGTILDKNGSKMSKTLGNVINPINQINKFTVDPVRYYFFTLPITKDSKYDEQELINVWNSDIVNGLGNLVSRTLHMVDKYQIKVDYSHLSEKKHIEIEEYKNEIDGFFTKYEFSKIRNRLNEIISNLNGRISDEKPFSKECSIEQRFTIINEIYWVLKNVLVYYYSNILKDEKHNLEKAFEENVKIILFEKL